MSTRLPRSRDLAAAGGCGPQARTGPGLDQRESSGGPPGLDFDYPCVVAVGIGSALPQGVTPHP